MAELQNFIDLYPESSRIDSCNKINDILRGKLERKELDITNQYYHIADYKAAIAAGQNFVKDFPESNRIDEVLFTIVDSYYLLAVNSLETKKLERLNLAMESYLKLVDLYPKSSFLPKAESVYESCVKMKNNINNK
jgi:outer membrane protein assembly factor BamD